MTAVSLLQEFTTLSDGILAYTFRYPASLEGRRLSIIPSRRPERYSSAAPLTADARQRIVCELVSLPDTITISVSVSAGSICAVCRLCLPCWLELPFTAVLRCACPALGCIRFWPMRHADHSPCTVSSWAVHALVPHVCAVVIAACWQVGPPSGVLKSKPLDEWTAREVADTVLQDR